MSMITNTGDETIRVLHVDDEPDFADMASAFLHREDDRLEVEAASSASDGLTRLANSQFDCVISDYDMPKKDGIEFLRDVRERWPDLPFILFTGKGSEAVAGDAISAGVTDYLQKSSGTEQYELLAHQITNAVEQSQAEQRVLEEQQRFHTLFDRLSQPTVEAQFKNDELITTRVNSAFEDVFGYNSNTLVGDSLDAHIVPDDRMVEAESINQCVQEGGRLKPREVVRETADGLREFLVQNAVYDDGSGGFAIYTDITDRRDREKRLERNRSLLRHTEQLADVGGWEADVETGEQRWTHGTYAIHDLDPGEEFEPSIETGIEFYHPDDRATVEQAVEKCCTHGEAYELTVRLITAEDEKKWVRTTGEPVYDDDGDDISKIRGAICDVTQQRERRQELEQIETLFQNTQDHLFLINVGGSFTIERLNPAWEDTAGISAEESCGKTVQGVLGEAQAKEIRQKYRKCVEQRETLKYDEQVQFGEKPARWETRIAPVIINGEVEYIAGASRDVTDIRAQKQELEELKQQYQTLAENFPDGAVYLIDDNFEYVRARGEALEQADLSPADIEGLTPHDVFPAELADEVCNRYEQAFNGNTVAVEEEYGGERYRTRVTPVDGDETEVTRVMAVAQNITEYAEDRQELQRQNERLDEFVSIVSHDLRNPLNVIEGNVELLSGECDSERIDSIQRSLMRINELIDNLLQLSRVGDNVTSRAPIELMNMFEDCWQNVETNSATFNIATNRTIRADRSQIAQLFENLIRNAVEHTSDDVTITVGGLENGFYVEDNGSGIPEDERDDVFEAGYSITKDGTGFGLSIVSKVAEAHGWDIYVTEGSEGGARFEITNVEFGPK